MAYSAQQLITSSWYLSGIVSRSLQTVSHQELKDGLDRLNAILDTGTSNMGLIPYFREYVFNAIPNQETYNIDNLVHIETLTFNIETVRYSILPATREEYFATGRVDNISSLPYQWYMEPYNGGSTIYLYFLPQEAYEMRLWGKFALTNVTQFQDISLVYDGFYIEYLRYKLAEYLCEYYNVVFPRSHRDRLKGYEQCIRNVSVLDLSMQKLSPFQSGAPFNYGDVNIGRGWRPTS